MKYEFIFISIAILIYNLKTMFHIIGAIAGTFIAFIFPARKPASHIIYLPGSNLNSFNILKSLKSILTIDLLLNLKSEMKWIAEAKKEK